MVRVGLRVVVASSGGDGFVKIKIFSHSSEFPLYENEWENIWSAIAVRAITGAAKQIAAAQTSEIVVAQDRVRD